MSSILIATLFTVVGGMRVWVESPLTRVFPNSEPTRSATSEANIYAAQGERESIQLCISADKKKPIENISIEAEGLGDQIAAPEIRRVGYICLPGAPPPTPKNGGDSAAKLAADPNMGEWFPDPLLAFAPFNLQAGETASIWITYDAPRGAKPGDEHGSISIRVGGKRKKSVPVSLHIFPFDIPETPSLRTAFALNRREIAEMYGLRNDSLEQWKPIYDALSRERVSFSVWEGDDLVVVPNEGVPETNRFKTHLEYVVNAAHMNSVDIGAGEFGTELWAPQKEGSLQDPMQFYLFDMVNWLQDQGWSDKGFIEPKALPARSHWQEARDAYFRVNRNDKRIKRLLVGAGDPYFERYADILATPISRFDPYADGLLRQGVSLSLKQKSPAKAVTASTSGEAIGESTYVTQPEDGYDGCLFTYWISRDKPKRSKPQTMQIDLGKRVSIQKLAIIWKRGFEAEDVSVRSIVDDVTSRPLEIQWRQFPATSPFTQSWLEGTFKDEQKFDSIQFGFSNSFHEAQVGVTEIVLGESPDVEPPEHIKPIEAWLATADGCFPTLAARAHPVEARMTPWVCWGCQSAGFVHRGLCRWPEGWALMAKQQPLVWPIMTELKKAKGSPVDADATGNGFLFYPGPDAPIPSIRSESLRDGMEDYEYLKALDKALSEGNKTVADLRLPDLAGVIAKRLYPVNPQAPELENMTLMINKGRVRMGWAIAQLADKK